MADQRKRLAGYDRELATRPDNAMLHFRRGVVLGALGRIPEAQAAFERAIELVPGYADAWVCLGDLFHALGAQDSATRAYEWACRFDPDAPGARSGLRRTHGAGSYVFRQALYALARRFGRSSNRAVDTMKKAEGLGGAAYVAEAIALLRERFGLFPGDMKVCLALGGLQSTHGNYDQAEALYRFAVRRWPRQPLSHYRLGMFFVGRGFSDAGIAALEECRRLDIAGGTDVCTVLSRLGRGDAPRSFNTGGVQTLFDQYADRFDSHLVETLSYKIPEMIGKKLAGASRIWPRMLDLGCGTGLCGVEMRRHGDFLVGVDLSENMISKANERKIYDDLRVGDCMDYLRAESDSFDLIVAADVLIYIGDMGPLLSALKPKLRPTGAFWFTVEIAGGDGYTVSAGNRFQHSLRYVKAAAAEFGLRVLGAQPVHIRMERDVPIPGLLVDLRHDTAKTITSKVTAGPPAS